MKKSNSFESESLQAEKETESEPSSRNCSVPKNAKKLLQTPVEPLADSKNAFECIEKEPRSASTRRQKCSASGTRRRGGDFPSQAKPGPGPKSEVGLLLDRDDPARPFANGFCKNEISARDASLKTEAQMLAALEADSADFLDVRPENDLGSGRAQGLVQLSIRGLRDSICFDIVRDSVCRPPAPAKNSALRVPFGPEANGLLLKKLDFLRAFARLNHFGRVFISWLLTPERLSSGFAEKLPSLVFRPKAARAFAKRARAQAQSPLVQWLREVVLEMVAGERGFLERFEGNELLEEFGSGFDFFLLDQFSEEMRPAQMLFPPEQPLEAVPPSPEPSLDLEKFCATLLLEENVRQTQCWHLFREGAISPSMFYRWLYLKSSMMLYFNRLVLMGTGLLRKFHSRGAGRCRGPPENRRVQGEKVLGKRRSGPIYRRPGNTQKSLKKPKK